MFSSSFYSFPLISTCDNRSIQVTSILRMRVANYYLSVFSADFFDSGRGVAVLIKSPPALMTAATTDG